MERNFSIFWKSATLLALIGAALFVVSYNSPTQLWAQEQPQQSSPSETQQPQAEPTSKPETKEQSAETKQAAKPQELDNQSCIDCHNPDILKLSKEDLADQVKVDDKPQPARTRPPFVMGELNLSVDEQRFAKSVHADTTCVGCHKDVTELPHAQRLAPVDCKECHDEAVETVNASAHGEKAKTAVPCYGCHDVHYEQGKATASTNWERKYCIDCHSAYKMNTEEQHKNLYEAKMHLELECMLCHSGAKAGVHNIPKAKTKVATCESCHTKNTILSKDKKQDVGFLSAEMLNKDAWAKYGYVLGAHRFPLLDTIIILAIIAPLGLPIVHGGLRLLTHKKHELPEDKIYLHPLPERLWHWFQALCIVMLIITGVIIHWPELFPGWFEWGVRVHNWFGIGAVVAFLFWLIYNIMSSRIKHYIPTKEDIPGGMIKQARFYGYGIFKHEPHPYSPSVDNKFNPLQKFAYFQFQVLLLPLLLISGVLYMYPETFAGIINAIGGITVLAIIHLVLAGLFGAFLVAHIYLATTGETVGENFKAIITGWGIDAHGDHGHDKTKHS